MKKNIIKILFFFLFVNILFTNPSIIFAKDVYLGGDSVGIEMNKNGVIISGTYDLVIDNKIYNPSKEANIKIGDVIVKSNNNNVSNSKDFITSLVDIQDSSLNLIIKRNSKTINTSIKIVKNGSSIKTGLYLKDKILGVGTLTYYDPETNNYGALGHEIIDSDTNQIFNDFDGYITDSEVDGYKKSENGNPGSKIATLDTDDKLGNILINTQYGIYGQYSETPSSRLISTASIDEVHKGYAQIATVLEGDKIEYYDINIIKLEKQKEISTKGITFEVVDEELLDKTNGIIQGMSGSPIIQDDKLIGAVTHVITNDVKCGYGIYIDFMIKISNSIYTE